MKFLLVGMKCFLCVVAANVINPETMEFVVFVVLARAFNPESLNCVVFVVQNASLTGGPHNLLSPQDLREGRPASVLFY